MFTVVYDIYDSSHSLCGAGCRCLLTYALVPQVTAIYNLVEGDQEHPYGEVDTVGVVVHVSNTVVTTARPVYSY